MSVLTISPSDSIQKALDAFDPCQKSVLKLFPGIYEEDLLLPTNVKIEGTGIADLDFTTIRTKHIFPSDGCIAFNHVKFESDGNAFLLCFLMFILLIKFAYQESLLNMTSKEVLGLKEKSLKLIM